MNRRRLTFLLALCVSLDLASSFVAGAFRFNPDESVDGVSGHSEEIRLAPGVASAPISERGEAGGQRLASPVRRPEGFAHIEWAVDLRRSHAPASRPLSLTEDHQVSPRFIPVPASSTKPFPVTEAIQWRI